MKREAPHVAFVSLVGFRVRDDAMRELGMSLPGLAKRGRALAELPALGLLTLASLTPEPWTCSYHSIARTDDALVDELSAEQPTVVAISALTASITEAYALADALRRRGIAVVLGGLHVSACRDEALRHANAVVVGSGESAWPAVLADARDQRLRGVYSATMAPRSPAPLPRYDLVSGIPQRFTLQTMRGCPLACEFCGASRLLGPVVEKPIEQVRRELAAICAIDPRPVIELADDNTFAGHRDADELLDVLEASGARWFTECDWRIGERPELLARLAQAGCVQVLVGVESLVFRYPGMGAKQAELQRVTDSLAAVQAAGVAVNGCFIVGADGEDRASLDRLVRYLVDCDLAEIQLTLQTPFPGTGLYRQLHRQGRLLADRDWSHYTLFDVTYRPDRLSVEDLAHGFREAVQAVFAAGPAARRERIRRDVLRARRNKLAAVAVEEPTP
jgi:radical SAM superfamily enzyme YgiQ (UPF0313 family)